MKEKQKKIMWSATGILTVLSVVVMYVVHRRVPFMMDDLWYSTILSDESVPISSFGDIVRSQIWHYQNWGGRSMTHGILQLTLLAGEQVADILNIIMTLLLAWVVCLTAENKNLPAFFAAMAMTLGLNANWKMSMFWQAGAANYLYITVFILLFAFCYLRELPDRKQKDGKGMPAEGIVQSKSGNGDTANGEKAVKSLPGITFWIVPLGILAGWSNENMGPAVWILSLLVILCAVREKRKIRLWMLLGNVSCLIGSILVIAAPGNFVRSAQISENEYGLLWRCFLRGYAESKAVLEYLFPTLLILSFVLIVGKCALKIAIGRRNLLLLFCALLSWGAMILSPHYPDRAAFGTMLFLICVILSMAGRIIRERKDMSWPLWGLSVLIWLRGMYFCGEYLAICWGWIR